jgi:parvulin-like peptidyl-prolyl isomerase
MAFHLTPQELNNLMLQVGGLVNRAQTSTSNSSFGNKLANEVAASSDELQKLLDSILKTNGIITDTQMNSINSQMEDAKLKILEQESKNNIKKYALYIGGGALLIGVLWFLTRKKS